MWNRDRSAERKAERVELLWGLRAKAIRNGIECLVLQVFEYTAVKVVRSVPCGKGNVTNLRELCAVVERCHFDCSDSLLRGVSILQCAILPDVRGRDTIDRKIHHGGARPAQRD